MKRNRLSHYFAQDTATIAMAAVNVMIQWLYNRLQDLEKNQDNKTIILSTSGTHNEKNLIDFYEL